MSTMAMLKSGLSKAAQATKSAAKAAADYSKETYKRLAAPPEHVRCSNGDCDAKLQVPSNIWDWPCPKCTLTNVGNEAKCSACEAPKPKLEREPAVQCPLCQQFTTVPTTTLHRNIKNMSEDTGKALNSAKVAAATKYEELKSRPSNFPCPYCQTVLNVPPEQGPLNEQGVEVLDCKVCERRVPVPGTNFSKSILATKKTVKDSSVKAYYTVASKPFITCPRCQSHNLAENVLGEQEGVCKECSLRLEVPNAVRAEVLRQQHEAAEKKKQEAQAAKNAASASAASASSASSSTEGTVAKLQ
eukprot:TRINITY_DN65648_c3_g7_i1.p2 TRINITY_DN65648_c3_g7~~TRINITY_DN65648_c3_g7_i1.p2  ORF type:complete len:301 (+),score=154.27 TRINITY_DN65648_c3_g7_i1:168-1070(+)